ncbi:MbcA/ParS/Xre antitoxin family protein [Fodinibius sp. Rm-B-1B1-1]|uniref:MbcA/ParS/Xre antitoxin family protein n=1 Tax=Fodinibius alkaliphilus TaxID=3140241 RepID=UPI003159CED7
MGLSKKHQQEIGRLFDRGHEVFGTSEKFNQWLTSPILALGKTTPLSHLDTEEGVDSVHAVLTRLEWGVHS